MTDLEPVANLTADPSSAVGRDVAVDLSPAEWVWLPSERTLPNSVALFRRDLDLREDPVRMSGWIGADSRYRLRVDGERVQWGPPPCDPRDLELDPVDLSEALDDGDHALGVEVLYYGRGDGTWPAGKPGFACYLEVEYADGDVERVLTGDGDWECHLDRAYPPGQHKRWFLRAFQEEFDARKRPRDWARPGFEGGDGAGESGTGDWETPMRLDCPTDAPPSCADYPGPDGFDGPEPDASRLTPRRIPRLREQFVSADLVAEGAVTWHRDPDGWFDRGAPDAYDASRTDVARPLGDGAEEDAAWRVVVPEDADAAVLTFALPEQVVGWPRISVDAPPGATVDVLYQEAHDPTERVLLRPARNAWARVVSDGDSLDFEAFEYESLRYLQVHVRGADRPVTVGDVRIRRRLADWPADPAVSCSDPALQRSFEASVNTLRNSAQDVVVDGMGRERQQYSGDCGHQLRALRRACGDAALPRRFLQTFARGLTSAGYFLDSWPAYDRLARLPARELGAARWGPILDHGVQFCLDCWRHYLHTGDESAVRDPYPKLSTFADYLRALRTEDGLLPVTDLGVPSVWIDHDAYEEQRHKQCAFTLAAAASFEHALAPLADALGESADARAFAATGRELREAAIAHFWNDECGLFVASEPWDGAVRLDDRSLATALLFDQCPDGRTDPAVEALVERPPELGLSYPANAYWRCWALAEHGRIDRVLAEFRERWATMRSVEENDAIGEFWHCDPDSGDQWSHCAVVPLVLLHEGVVGLRPTAPGYERAVLRPQLADVDRLSTTTHTPLGPVDFVAERERDGHDLRVALPGGLDVDLLVPEPIADRDRIGTTDGLHRYRLTGGETHAFHLP